MKKDNLFENGEVLDIQIQKKKKKKSSLTLILHLSQKLAQNSSLI